jgi:hypothetical protein
MLALPGEFGAGLRVDGWCGSLAKVSHSAWELSGDPSPGDIIAGFTSHAEAVFPAVEAVAAKLARDGLDAIIEGLPVPRRPHHAAAAKRPGRGNPAHPPDRRVTAATPRAHQR